MVKLLFKVLLVAGTYFFVNFNILYAGAGTSGGVTLLQPIGARANGMGEAYTTSEDDILSIYYNPALELNSSQFSVFYKTGIAEDSFNSLGLGIPFGFGSLATTIVNYDAGTILLLDSAGNERTVNAQTDNLITITLSKKINKVVIGGNFKILNSKLVEEFSATSNMFDIGGKIDISKKIKIGLSFQNLGGEIKYSEKGDKLPQTLRTGLAYRTLNGLIMAIDIVKIADKNIKENIGIEYTLKQLLLRLGYKIGYDVENMSWGLGFLTEKFSIDYAYVPSWDLGNTHRVSLNYKFSTKITEE